MLEFLKDWVVNIVTVAIFIVIFEMIIPSGKMKKIVNLITGFILMITLITPVLKVVGKEVVLKEFQMANSNYIDKKEITANSKTMEEDQIKQTINVYRSKLIDQLILMAKSIDGVGDAKADIMINEDYTSEKFGEIKRVYLYINTEEEEREPVISIEKIQIGETDPKADNQSKTKKSH